MLVLKKSFKCFFFFVFFFVCLVWFGLFGFVCLLGLFGFLLKKKKKMDTRRWLPSATDAGVTLLEPAASTLVCI